MLNLFILMIKHISVLFVNISVQKGAILLPIFNLFTTVQNHINVRIVITDSISFTIQCAKYSMVSYMIHANGLSLN